MTTSRTASRNTSRKRTGIIGYLGNIADDTKDYVDDMLDRGREVDRDLRSTARRTLRDDEDEDENDDIDALRDELDELTKRVERLTEARSSQNQPKKSS